MRILSKYLIREFIKLLMLCQVVFLWIYITIDFLQKIDNFIEAQVLVSMMLTYFLFKIPFVIVQTLPPAALISAIIMFSLMKKRDEIAVIKACGINIFRPLSSIITCALVLGVAVFLLSEIAVPYTSSRSNEIWNIEVEKRDPALFYGRNTIWYRSRDAIYWIKHFDNEKMVMSDSTFYFFDKGFHLVKRIDGRRAVWKEGKWKIEEGIIQEATNGEGFHIKRFEKLCLDLPETPQTFMRVAKRPEEMNYWQLKHYAEKVRREGYDNTGYLVDMHIKIAFPCVILVLVIIGISISLRQRRGGIPVAVTIGMAICFLYLSIFGFARSLGMSGALPPLLSAWLANLVFLFIGIYLMLHMER